MKKRNCFFWYYFCFCIEWVVKNFLFVYERNNPHQSAFNMVKEIQNKAAESIASKHSFILMCVIRFFVEKLNSFWCPILSNIRSLIITGQDFSSFFALFFCGSFIRDIPRHAVSHMHYCKYFFFLNLLPQS